MTTSTTTTPYPGRSLLIGVLLAGAVLGVILIGPRSFLQTEATGVATNPPMTATTPETGSDRNADPVLYILGSDADREVVQAFTAQFNQDRLGRGRPLLGDAVVVQSAAAAAELERQLDVLSLWQAGVGRTLRVTDLR